ncbi:ABC transporter substrate-binding protein [Paenibacillus sp. J5C_2022]|uniref:ABC transporter substrate-binding protein n=1 Tax=Paenibacillus sp. J5C2022 TaxID=2977129 RepID=UPI0021D16179|nr:ABC transporter substrate-binding protein [Paenibacillus sp. J5C2022]MCU6712687.1 ABC transporter substrate-binding protein [Paenibacillus sp. J5C2022]
MFMKRIVSLLITMSLCLIALSACSQHNVEPNASNPDQSEVTASSLAENKHYPLTLTIYDDAGKEMQQTIKKEPKRIVVIGQGFAEWMIAFGEEKRIAGLAYLDKSFSEYEEQIKELPIMTDMWPSKEAILELQPDLIISMSSAFQKERIGDISFWNKRGIPVLAGINYTTGRTIDSFFEDIENLGTVLNIQERTNAFIEKQRDQIREIGKIAERAQDKPNVLLLGTSGETTYYYGPSLCLIDEMIVGAGGEYIQVSKDTYVEMSEESILSVNPDKIIITGFQKSDSQALIDQFLHNPKLKNATAIKTGNVKVVEYTTAVRGSLGLADLYKDVARYVQPELFKGE